MDDDLVPPGLRHAVAGRAAGLAADLGPTGDEWLRRLPALVAEHLAGWRLQVDGPSRHGECALVVPVRGSDWPAAMLKVTWPHEEAGLEHLALGRWAGRGAVRLLAADPDQFVLLLERLDPERELKSAPILDACEVIGQLMRALDRPATPQFTSLVDLAQSWSGRLRAGSPLVPRRLTEQAASTLDALVVGTRSGSDSEPVDLRLVHTDLHDRNVLAPLDPARGSWLAIDPKPVAGEWAYAVAPIVWNRPEAAAAATSLRTHVRLRAEIVADAAGLNPDRVRAWTLVRLMINACDAADHGPPADAFRARMIALAKAFLT